jgi:alpha-ketoglutarate-dependent taurine dioxygenase
MVLVNHLRTSLPKATISPIIEALLANDVPLAQERLEAIKPVVYDWLDRHLYCVLETSIAIPTDRASDIFWFIHSHLFRPVAQSRAETMIVDVKTEGKSTPLTKYHKTSDGFHFHTDGTYSLPPRYITLACVTQADAGGDSFVIDIPSLLPEIAQKPDLYELLSNFRFCFKSTWNDEATVLYKKILELNADGSLERINYFRNTIEAGHQLANKPLTTEQTAALNYLDMLFFKHISDIRFQLKAGDFLIVDNHKMIHGRMPFKEQNHQRHLLRMWGD